MDSKIQQLTEAIYSEGVLKAREEAEASLKEANEKAARIEEEAKKAAGEVMAETKRKAEEFRKNVNSEVRLTLNQSISALRQEIASLITLKVVNPAVRELFSEKDYLKSLVTTIVKAWIEKESFDLDVILPEKDKHQMEEYFRNNLADECNKGVSLSFSPDVKSGFKIGPADGSYVISFTDEDFMNFLKAYLRPKTSQLLFSEGK
jgi:V/A-type H+-transporting ATPase subunit E